MYQSSGHGLKSRWDRIDISDSERQRLNCSIDELKRTCRIHPAPFV